MSSEVELPAEIERYIIELCASTSDKTQQLVLMLVAKSVYDWICPVFYGDMEIELSRENRPAGWDRYKSLSGSPADARIRHLFTKHLRSLKFDISWPIIMSTSNIIKPAVALFQVFSASRPSHLFLELPEDILDEWEGILKPACSFPLTHLHLGYNASWVLCYPDLAEKLRSCPVVDTVTHLFLSAGGNSPHKMIEHLPMFRALTRVALCSVNGWPVPIKSIRTLPQFLVDKTVVLVQSVDKLTGYGTWNTEEWLIPNSHPNIVLFVESYRQIFHDLSIWDRAEAQLKMQNEKK